MLYPPTCQVLLWNIYVICFLQGTGPQDSLLGGTTTKWKWPSSRNFQVLPRHRIQAPVLSSPRPGIFSSCFRQGQLSFTQNLPLNPEMGMLAWPRLRSSVEFNGNYRARAAGLEEEGRDDEGARTPRFRFLNAQLCTTYLCERHLPWRNIFIFPQWFLGHPHDTYIYFSTPSSGWTVKAALWPIGERVESLSNMKGRGSGVRLSEFEFWLYHSLVLGDWSIK